MVQANLLQDLPDDLFLEVMGWLPARTVAVLRQCSRVLHARIIQHRLAIACDVNARTGLARAHKSMCWGRRSGSKFTRYVFQRGLRTTYV